MIELLLHVCPRHESVGLDHGHRSLVGPDHLVLRQLRGGGANVRLVAV